MFSEAQIRCRQPEAGFPRCRFLKFGVVGVVFNRSGTYSYRSIFQSPDIDGPLICAIDSRNRSALALELNK